MAEKKSAAKAPAAKRAVKRANAAVAKKAAVKQAVARANVAVAKKTKRPAKPPRVKLVGREGAAAIYAKLRAAHPDAHCELDHGNAFELLVATVLSAQTTDKLVNTVTPTLFERWPTAQRLAAEKPEVVAEHIASRGMGMYNQKAKNIVGLAKRLVSHHGGEVPRSLEALIELPGVGRKTANVVLGVIWNDPAGVVVDTHVQRLSQRLGFTKKTEPEPIEQELCKLFPRPDWDMLSHTLIFHGRRVCTAISPACGGCPVSDLCPAAFKAEWVGRKPARER